MYCAKCGARLAEGAKKCDKCGKAVRVRPAVASEKRSEIAFDYAPGSLNGKDNAKEKSGDYVPADQEVKDPVFFEEPGENVDVQSIIRIAHGEEPVSKETGPEPDDGKKPVNSNNRGKLRYGAVTPLEKARRRIAEMRHHLQETAEEKRMKRHMELAARHYESLGASPTPILKSAPKKSGESRKSSDEAVIPAREAKKAAARQTGLEPEARKAAARQTGLEPEAKKTAARQTDFEPEAKKAESIEEQVAREREEKIRAQQKKQEEQEKQTRKAGGHAEAERADSPVSSGPQVTAAEEKIPPVQKTAAEYEEPAERKTAEGEAPEREETAEGESRTREAAAQSGTPETEAAERKAVEEKILAEQKARKALEEQKRRERDRRAHRTAARPERVLSEEEKQLREARRIRRYYEEEPDAMDLFLDKFGLTKETGVKIATLFLVVVLSLVYVIGRSRSGGTDSSSPSGEGAAGETFSISPESEETEDSDVFDDSDLPTGGGDFEHSQSETDAQQEGPDTQEPTENEAP